MSASVDALGMLYSVMPNGGVCGIYVIRNTASGTFYIGSSAQCTIRERHHFNALKAGTHANVRLQRSYDRHGRDAFVFEVISVLPADHLEATEGRLLTRLVGHPDCTNMKLSGHGGRLGCAHSPETRAKIGAAHRGRPKHPDHIARMAAAKKGLIPKVDASARARMSEATRRAWTGRKHSPEAIEKMRAKQRVKTPAQLAAIAKVSQGNVGRTHTVSDAARRKMSEAKKGMKWPPDVIARRTAAIRAAYEKKRAGGA